MGFSKKSTPGKKSKAVSNSKSVTKKQPKAEKPKAPPTVRSAKPFPKLSEPKKLKDKIKVRPEKTLTPKKLPNKELHKEEMTKPEEKRDESKLTALKAIGCGKAPPPLPKKPEVTRDSMKTGLSPYRFDPAEKMREVQREKEKDQKAKLLSPPVSTASKASSRATKESPVLSTPRHLPQDVAKGRTVEKTSEPLKKPPLLKAKQTNEQDVAHEANKGKLGVTPTVSISTKQKKPSFVAKSKFTKKKEPRTRARSRHSHIEEKTPIKPLKTKIEEEKPNGTRKSPKRHPLKEEEEKRENKQKEKVGEKKVEDPKGSFKPNWMRGRERNRMASSLTGKNSMTPSEPIGRATGENREKPQAASESKPNKLKKPMLEKLRRKLRNPKIIENPREDLEQISPEPVQIESLEFQRGQTAESPTRKRKIPDITVSPPSEAEEKSGTNPFNEEVTNTDPMVEISEENQVRPENRQKSENFFSQVAATMKQTRKVMKRKVEFKTGRKVETVEADDDPVRTDQSLEGVKLPLAIESGHIHLQQPEEPEENEEKEIVDDSKVSTGSIHAIQVEHVGLSGLFDENLADQRIYQLSIGQTPSFRVIEYNSYNY